MLRTHVAAGVVALGLVGCASPVGFAAAERPPPPLSGPLGIKDQDVDRRDDADPVAERPATRGAEWAWASATLPSLSEQRRTSPASAAWDALAQWAAPGQPIDVFARTSRGCREFSGSFVDNAFVGYSETDTRTAQNARVNLVTRLEITANGIHERGPWFARVGGPSAAALETAEIGWKHALAPGSITAADSRSASFGGYAYRIDPLCLAEPAAPPCEANADPPCSRCRLGARRRPLTDRAPAADPPDLGIVECAAGCAALERLAPILERETFYDAFDPQPVVFRSAAACQEASAGPA